MSLCFLLFARTHCCRWVYMVTSAVNAGLLKRELASCNARNSRYVIASLLTLLDPIRPIEAAARTAESEIDEPPGRAESYADP